MQGDFHDLLSPVFPQEPACYAMPIFELTTKMEEATLRSHEVRHADETRVWDQPILAFSISHPPHLQILAALNQYKHRSMRSHGQTETGHLTHIPGVQKILWWIYQKGQERIPKACQNSGNKRFCTETRRQIFQNRMDPQIYFFQRNPPCPVQCTIKSAKGAL